jgi:hypothetical protein
MVLSPSKKTPTDQIDPNILFTQVAANVQPHVSNGFVARIVSLGFSALRINHQVDQLLGFEWSWGNFSIVTSHHNHVLDLKSRHFGHV